MRYAKIAPAALHGGKFDGRCRQGVEAVGRRPKFELDDFRHAIAAAAVPIPQRQAWPQVEQSLP
jgi:hypothetical protein